MITSGFNLRPFTENDSAGFTVLQNLLYPDHIMSLDSFCHYEKTRESKIQHKQWVWKNDNDILCSALYTQWGDSYHPQKFVIKIYIHPDQHGKGYGTFCYNHLINKLASLDPIKLSVQVYEPHIQSISFFENRGFNNTITECESSLDLINYDPKLYQVDIDRILNQKFRIVTLSEFRKANKNADYKAWELERDVGPDMPWTDPITVPEFDVFKKKVFGHPKFNPDSWFLVLDNDQIVGLNNLWKNELNKGIDTGLTGVRREYRRRGIATALKHTSVIWAKQQGYEWIRTDNATTNKGMLTINIRAGFKFMPAWLLFEKILKE